MKNDLMPLPKLRKFYESTTRTFCFTFENGGWAHFGVNVDTGEFNVQSDWGNYGHRWPVQHIGESTPTMLHFLTQCGADYIVDKLSYDEPNEFTQEFDEDATRKELQKYICEKRQHLIISKDEARCAFNELESLDTPEGFYYQGTQCVNVFKHVDVHEYFVYVKSNRYRVLLEQLIPLFQEKLKDLGYGKQKTK